MARHCVYEPPSRARGWGKEVSSCLLEPVWTRVIHRLPSEYDVTAPWLAFYVACLLLAVAVAGVWPTSAHMLPCYELFSTTARMRGREGSCKMYRDQLMGWFEDEPLLYAAATDGKRVQQWTDPVRGVWIPAGVRVPTIAEMYPEEYEKRFGTGLKANRTHMFLSLVKKSPPAPNCLFQDRCG